MINEAPCVTPKLIAAITAPRVSVLQAVTKLLVPFPRSRRLYASQILFPLISNYSKSAVTNMAAGR